ncbi:MAG: helix-turn-helix transcriptional regulator [Chloroflexota bacterium]
MIRELRQVMGWTQQDLAEQSGLSRSYVSRLEMGDIALPSSERLRALSSALGAAPDDLLQAAGYIDAPSNGTDLPEIKAYLKRRYGINNQQLLRAIEAIVLELRHEDEKMTNTDI